MRVTGGSDLARMQALQKQALATRNRLDTAATEMTTNLKASRFEATGGNLTRLFALERSLDRNAVFTENITLTELRLEVMQGSLGQMLAPLEDLSLDMVTATSQGDYSTAMLHATTARSAFAATVGLLNGQVAGQSLFAGVATDSPALAPPRTRSSPTSTRWPPGRPTPPRPSRRSTPTSPSRPEPSTPRATSARPRT